MVSIAAVVVGEAVVGGEVVDATVEEVGFGEVVDGVDDRLDVPSEEQATASKALETTKLSNVRMP